MADKIEMDLRITSDVGSQYHCGQVGRGVQPPFILAHPAHTRTHTVIMGASKMCVFAIFDLISMMDQQMDQWTNGWSDKALG